MVSVGLLPGLGESALDWFDEHQPTLADAADVALRCASAYRTDASASLRHVRAPTLVLHAVDDPLITFTEARHVAATIPNSRLRMLDAGGHALPLHEEIMSLCRPAFADFLRTPGDRLLPELPVDHGQPPGRDPLSSREVEVLDLVARGLSNAEVAEELYLSPRTVERHLSNIYLKLGVAGATARVAAVTTHLRGDHWLHRGVGPRSVAP